MWFTGGYLYAALALASYLPGILATPSADNSTEVANNNTYVGNVNENDVADVGKYIEDENVELDPNDISGSLNQHVQGLMFGLGVCDFDVSSLGGLSVRDQLQLILQLQQLAQLQALGLVDSVSIGQLVQKELLLNNFRLNIIKRTIGSAVKQASRGKRRVIMRTVQCENVNAGDNQNEQNNGAENAQNEDAAQEEQGNNANNNEDAAQEDQGNNADQNENGAQEDQANDAEQNEGEAAEDAAAEEEEANQDKAEQQEGEAQGENDAQGDEAANEQEDANQDAAKQQDAGEGKESADGANAAGEENSAEQ